jgi:hypothetical protein
MKGAGPIVAKVKNARVFPESIEHALHFKRALSAIDRPFRAPERG